MKTKQQKSALLIKSATSMVITLAASMLPLSGTAYAADLIYTYTSGDMQRTSAYLYGQPTDDYGMPTSPGFTFSFRVNESLLSTQPITLTLPASSASTIEQHFNSTPAVTSSGNSVTINPDRSIAGWDFSMLLRESVLFPPFDPRATLVSSYGAGTCNCSTFRYNTILYTERGWGYEELGPAEVTYRSDALPGNWTFAAVSAVPEPQTYLMMLGGLGLMGGLARSRKKSVSTLSG